ncbi:FAD-binding monooxygenase [Micrococcales bacterium 31B]|nr:FAD-binding monooxygenase [Micrococcales bacterium 31B]
MQFHHFGYVSGDPRVEPAAGVGIDRPENLPDNVDVLIVGTGPAGIMLAAQLSQFPQFTTRAVERRGGRLEVGQADGIQARSVETFQAFGFAKRITEEAYQITEMAFWKPDVNNPKNIVRTAVAPDDPANISELPHLIVNQARVQDYFLEFMANSPARNKPDYGWEFVTLTRDDTQEYPIAVTLKRTVGDDAGTERIVNAKYVVGGDGARSRVRESIGRKLQGDQAFHAWGVMDVLADTDFPDIRRKCAIQSNDGGSILHIPREGNHLFRMYVDLGEVSPDDSGSVRKTTQEEVEARANQILHPYTVQVRHVAWRSVYEVGHRVTDSFDDADAATGRKPRVFIMGDACHTHSAKAGQGMNVSMQDGFNLGWKLGHVLSGRAPEELLATYSAERQVIAQNLIDFDKQWSSLMAAKPEQLSDPEEVERFYVQTAEFPAGFMTEYVPSMIVAGDPQQDLAAGFTLGKRFHSRPVMRVCDGVPVQLGHHARADGKWRIYVFAGQDGLNEGSATATLAAWLNDDAASPLVKYRPEGANQDVYVDTKVIYQAPHIDVNINTVPAAFRPRVGPYQVFDYEKIYAVDPADDIFEARNISRDGAIVVVRPDQYVAHILPLDGTDSLAAFFDGVFVAPAK